MPTVAPTQRSALPVGTIPGDNRFAIVDATWDLYDRLTDAVGEERTSDWPLTERTWEVADHGAFARGFQGPSRFIRQKKSQLS